MEGVAEAHTVYSQLKKDQRMLIIGADCDEFMEIYPDIVRNAAGASSSLDSSLNLANDAKSFVLFE